MSLPNKYKKFKSPMSTGETREPKMDETLKKYIPLIILIILFLSLNYAITKNLVALPSPLYGGDYYYQLGGTNHVKYGGNSLESPNIAGSLPVYLPLYSMFTGNIARVFNISAMSAEFIFSYILLIASIIVVYILLLKLFDNMFIPVIGVLIFILPASLPIIKYTDMAYFLMMPLLLLSIYWFVNKPDIKNSIILGIVYGLIGLTHSIAFIASSMLLGLVFIYYSVIRNIDAWKITDIARLKKLWKTIMPYVIILAIGVCIAMLWWYKPIFIYHGQTSLHYTEWNNSDLSPISAQLKFIWDTIFGSLLSFGNLTQFVFSILFITGVLGLIFAKSKNNRDDSGNKSGDSSMHKNIIYLRFLLVSSLIITFHYLITQNILGTSFVPGYIVYLLLTFVRMLVAAFGAYICYSMIKRRIHIDAGKKYFKYAFFSAIILLLAIGYIGLYNGKMKDQWYNAGKSALPAQLTDLEKYITTHTGVYDTILTTKEVGFAINALTGRKLMIARRAHNDPFMNMDQRELDAAIILYGNNTKEKLRLLKEYNITYLYWDTYWIQSEYTFNDKGQITNWFDPIISFYSPEKEKLWKDNNVSYFIENTWVDPALRGPEQKKFDLMFCSPQNYNSFIHPWKSDIDPYLKEVWSYSQGGQKIAVLYKVEI